MNVIVVDDHALFREGLALLLRAIDADLQVLHAGSVDQALVHLEGQVKADMVFLDLGLPGIGGIDGLRLLHSRANGVPIVVLSGREEPQTVRACIDAGAMGYILKASDGHTMLQALRQILAGVVYLPPLIGSGVGLSCPTDVAGELHRLTPRQREVLACLVLGKPNKLIARELGINETTVKSHVTAVLRALGAANRTEAVYAVRHVALRRG